MEDAERLIMLMRRECGEHARYALDVIVEETSIEEYAKKSQVSIRTAQRRFAIGARMLRKIDERLQSERDGNACLVELVRTVCRRNEAHEEGK